MKNKFKQFISYLFSPVDIASTVLFRIAFGALMMWEVYRYFIYGRIERQFMGPKFHFTYFGFDWVSPWPGDGMLLQFYVMGGLAFCIMTGFMYRFATILFFLAFTHVFLIEQALYLNHFYLLSLVSMIMIFIPAHRAYSFDSFRNPSLRSDVIPAWALWLLRIQVGIPYFFGGIAKINYDWLHGEPLRMWFSHKTMIPFLGPYMREEWLVYAFSYGGLLFDLFIVPLLLWRKTRLLAYVCVIIFNLTNAWLFNIGVFPWMMIAASTIFFDPDWPRRFIPSTPQVLTLPKISSLQKRATCSLLVIYLTIQFLVPFRHWLYPSVVHWTEEGHLFAWHMKLRSKSGHSAFYIRYPNSDKKIKVNVRKHLTKRQYSKMSTHPEMILQYAHHLAKMYKKKEGVDVEVYAEALVSLNGRDSQKMIDDTVDLSKVKSSLLPASWIVPLDDPRAW